MLQHQQYEQLVLSLAAGLLLLAALRRTPLLKESVAGGMLLILFAERRPALPAGGARPSPGGGDSKIL